MRYFFILFVMNCFLLTSLNGVSPPNPIVGSPNILTPKFSAGSGSFLFEIETPSEWGLGNVSVSPDGSAHFELYPKNGGNGCVIEIESYNSDEKAANVLNKLRNKFKNTKDLDDGFEAELSQAWFSGRVYGQLLIQTWYSLSKKRSEHKSHWKDLKNCLHVSNVEDTISEPLPREPVKRTIDGWVFTHPTKEQFVIFKTFGEMNNDNTFSYLISFDDFAANAIGHFYLEWDQECLDTTEPYQSLADKISLEMKAIDSNQFFDPIKILPQEGYAIMSGYPYGVVIVSGDNFLFGFAVKHHFDFKDIDINALIQKVKWSVLK